MPPRQAKEIHVGKLSVNIAVVFYYVFNKVSNATIFPIGIMPTFIVLADRFVTAILFFG